MIKELKVIPNKYYLLINKLKEIIKYNEIKEMVSYPCCDEFYLYPLYTKYDVKEHQKNIDELKSKYEKEISFVEEIKRLEYLYEIGFDEKTRKKINRYREYYDLVKDYEYNIKITYILFIDTDIYIKNKYLFDNIHSHIVVSDDINGIYITDVVNVKETFFNDEYELSFINENKIYFLIEEKIKK